MPKAGLRDNDLGTKNKPIETSQLWVASYSNWVFLCVLWLWDWTASDFKCLRRNDGKRLNLYRIEVSIRYKKAQTH